MNKTPVVTITLTPRQVALVHDFIFGPAHLSCNRFTLVKSYIELMRYRPQIQRPLAFQKLSECLIREETLFKCLADAFEQAVLSVHTGKFSPHYEGEISGESFHGLRRPTAPVLLKEKELEGYFERLAGWAKTVTALLHATSITIEQSADAATLKDIRDKFQRDSSGLWEKQKSLIAEFNTMCGIERRELQQPCQMS
jgi:hypothetical protein